MGFPRYFDIDRTVLFSYHGTFTNFLLAETISSENPRPFCFITFSDLMGHLRAHFLVNVPIAKTFLLPKYCKSSGELKKLSKQTLCMFGCREFVNRGTTKPLSPIPAGGFVPIGRLLLPSGTNPPLMPAIAQSL